MNPEELTPEELLVWNNGHSEKWRVRSIKAMRALKKQKPVTLEQMRAQVVRLFKSGNTFTPEEEAIWSDTTLTEFERYVIINDVRVAKKRVDFFQRKHRREEEAPEPMSRNSE